MMESINKVWPKWQAVEVIGKGGFGTVYKAKRESFGETSYSAIKVVKIPNDDGEIKEMTSSGMSKEHIKDYYKKSVKSLIDEIKLMEKIKSASHVVGIEDYEVEECEDGIGWKVYIRMELLTNITDYFAHKEISVDEVKKLGIDILTALEYCHQLNIIHRDIKPGNIFVSEFGEYKLGDFGISREVEKTNATMSQKGTKSYMAPEMIRMTKYGKDVDLYALGLTMYELLNHGRMPFLPSYPQPFFPNDREEAMFKRLNGEEFPEIAGVGELNTIIKKACHVNPNMRYQSASEMKNALTNCGNQEKTVNTFSDNEEKTMNIFSNSEEKTSNMFTSQDNKTVNVFASKEDKTVGIFGKDFLFDDTKTSVQPSIPQQKVNQTLESLHVKCPHCGEEAYLVAPKVYVCNDCWKMVRMSEDAKTIELNNLYVDISNNVGKPQIQLEAAKKMYDLAPNNAQVVMRLGLYYGMTGNNEKKLELYKKALELDDRDATIYNNLGVYYINVDNYKAADYLNKAVELQKKGSTTLPNKEGLYKGNLAIAYELTGQSVTAFIWLVSAYNAGYEDCTAIVNRYNVGTNRCANAINRLLSNHVAPIPQCCTTYSANLEEARKLFQVKENEKVICYFNPKLLFGGKKQGMLFTDRAFYFFDKGEPTYICYYRLGRVTFKANWQGHVEFKFLSSKTYTYDVQFGPDAKIIPEFFKAFRKELGIFHSEDLQDFMNTKKK